MSVADWKEIITHFFSALTIAVLTIVVALAFLNAMFGGD